MSRFQNVLFSLCIYLSLPILSFASEDVKESIVKIFTTHQRYSYSTPWQSPLQDQSSGSGCVIAGNLILTNAHVVANQVFVQVTGFSKSEMYEAEVVSIDHDCDLALLKVFDESFFDGIAPLHIGEGIQLRDEIFVYGYPMGGDDLSITKGIVSRIEPLEYAHSGHSLIAYQIDAAINPGNSGGPALMDEQIVGIVMQTIPSGDGLGFMIPPELITRFLNESDKEHYVGIPDLGIKGQLLENKDLRRYLGMKDQHSGFMVMSVAPQSSAFKDIKSGDVVLEINGLQIANNGSVLLENGKRVSAMTIIQRGFIGEEAEIKILRKKEELFVKVPLQASLGSHDLVPRTRYDVAPRYFITGGIVFQPLTQNYLMEWGRDWNYLADKYFLKEFFYGKQSSKKKEVVFISQVLADKLTAGYQYTSDIAIENIDGKNISSLEDVVKAVEESKNDFIVIQCFDGKKIVLDRHKVFERHEAILKKYQIHSDRRV
ncbi:MAG: S1-C subfamily serine protease [Chlamydiales bacterium]|jgi:S1-C subfamily serine protease